MCPWNMAWKCRRLCFQERNPGRNAEKTEQLLRKTGSPVSAGSLSKKLFFSIPAVGAEFAGGDADGSNHVIQPVIVQGGEIQLLSDLFHHLFVIGAVRVSVALQHVFCVIPFPFLDDPSGNKIQVGRRTGEVQKLASVDQGRAGRTDVDFLCTAVIQEFRGFPQLRATDDGVVNEQQLFVMDQSADRDQLHVGNQVTLALIGRHKGSGPGWCIFDKRPGEGNAGFIGISNGVGDTGVRNAGHTVRTYQIFVPLCQHFSAVITHFFHIDPFIGGSGVSVVNPEERTDFHVLSRRADGFHTFRSHENNFARSQFPVIIVSQVQIRKAFKGSAVGVVFFSENDRGASKTVPGSINTFFCEEPERSENPEQSHGCNGVLPEWSLFG